MLKEMFSSLPTEGENYAVLDFDNTCILNDIGHAVLAYTVEHENVPKEVFLEYYDLVNKGLNYKWKTANELKQGDMLIYPKLKQTSKKPHNP